MTLRRKLLLSMVIPALLLVMMGAIGVYSLWHLKQAAGRILSNNYRSIQEARSMSRSLRVLQDLDGEVDAVSATRRDAAVREFEDALRRGEGNITETGELAVLRKIRRSWQQLRPRLGAGKAAFGRILRPLHADIEDLVSVNEVAMIAYERETRQVARGMLGAVTIAALAALFALALFAITSAYRISRPVTEVADRLHEALNPTSPDKPVPPRRTVDEIVRLREELDALLHRLARYEDEQQRKLSHQFEESRQRFISMLSHQLKTPMTSLTMAVNLVREKLEDSPAHAELLSIATESCNSLSALISELIDAARETTADFVLKRRRVDVVRLLRAALRPLSPQADAKGVTLIMPTEQLQVHASVDPVKFPWVVTNIAGNALRYTERGGRIEVAVRLLERQVEVSVKDTGAGITRENLGRIFQPYVSLDPEPQPGTHGLGLAIAKEIVEAHGGRIEASSEPGRGTEFVIHVPS